MEETLLPQARLRGRVPVTALRSGPWNTSPLKWVWVALTRQWCAAEATCSREAGAAQRAAPMLGQGPGALAGLQGHAHRCRRSRLATSHCVCTSEIHQTSEACPHQPTAMS